MKEDSLRASIANAIEAELRAEHLIYPDGAIDCPASKVIAAIAPLVERMLLKPHPKPGPRIPKHDPPCAWCELEWGGQ